MPSYVGAPTEGTPKRSRGIKSDEADILDAMLTALVDILERKGVVTQEEREQEIKKRLKT